MTPARLPVILSACVAALAFGQAPEQPPRFRVAVDVVSVDAVVTDRNGAIVRDLTASDFEVLQDGKPQKVTSAQFVPVTAPAPPSKSAASTPRSAPPVPAAPVTRESTQRTIVVVVDDLGLSFEGMHNVRQALHKFVDASLLPTDLTAIMRTGEARSLVQPLTTDRGALHSAIDGLHYNTLSRKGVVGLPDIVQAVGRKPEFDDVGSTRELGSIMGALAALELVVQSARELPGRRAVIFASEGFGLGVPDKIATGDDGERVFMTARVRDAVDRVIDQATRAGVVIYTVDGQTLQSGGLRASDDLHSTPTTTDPMEAAKRDAMQQLVTGMDAARRAAMLRAQDSLTYLAEQTGGFAVVNTNDLPRGLGRISSDVRDYYVIGYQPDDETFKRTRTTVPIHHVEVRVRRSGLRVRSRKQFAGLSDPAESAAPPTPAQQLVRAAISPFSTTAIAVHATNLPGYAPGHGSFVRSVLHLDARALGFSANANGSRTATVDLVAVVFNSGGVQVGTYATGFDVTAADADAAAQLTSTGLVYATRVPIAAPGGYQLRYAVRDRRSGAIGSGGGFVEVPDVAGGAFALSGIVVRAGDHAAESLDSDRFSLRPDEALHVFPAGTQLSYSCEIYNADPSVRAAANLWRGTKKIATLPAPAVVRAADRGGSSTASGTLTLANLPPDTYMLQVGATFPDPKAPKKTRAAVQWFTFEVTAGRAGPR